MWWRTGARRRLDVVNLDVIKVMWSTATQGAVAVNHGDVVHDVVNHGDVVNCNAGRGTTSRRMWWRIGARRRRRPSASNLSIPDPRP
jgi:hypothetical protein